MEPQSRSAMGRPSHLGERGSEMNNLMTMPLSENHVRPDRAPGCVVTGDTEVVAAQAAPGSHSAGKSKEEIAAAYDSPPWWYDLRGFFILTFAYNSTLGHQLRFFGRHFGPKHLEVACGTGTLLEMILFWRKWKDQPPSDITGIDYAEAMLAGAKQRFARTPSVSLCQADAAALPYSDHMFDTANIANAIHCFPDVQGALRDIFRVLKKDGTVAANVLLYPRGVWPLKVIAGRINRWGIRKGILYTPYQKEEIRRYFTEAGFEVVSENLSGNCYDIIARKP
jgi:ubiquinone/menaquinone biosynthesis C-methylase UbiE